VRTAVGNFFSNVSDVYSAANNLLQGKPSRAAEDTMRVAINSVLGIGGLIDIATPAGLPKYKEDFGQTWACGACRAAVPGAAAVRAEQRARYRRHGGGPLHGSDHLYLAVVCRPGPRPSA
jgi:hypothetical protein